MNNYDHGMCEMHMIAHEAFGTLTNYAATNAECPQHIRTLAADYDRRMKEAKAIRDSEMAA